MGAVSYPQDVQAAYTISSDLPSQPFSVIENSETGGPYTSSGTTDSAGDASGTIETGNVVQEWEVTVSFSSARCYARYTTLGTTPIGP